MATTFATGIVVLLLAVACGERPAVPVDWPLPHGLVAFQQSGAESETISQEQVDRVITRQKEIGHAQVMGADVIAMGRVSCVTRCRSGVECARICMCVDVEEWIKGCCSADSIRIVSRTGLGFRKKPEPGDRYIFLMKEVGDDYYEILEWERSTCLEGKREYPHRREDHHYLWCGPRRRLEIRDGIVVEVNEPVDVYVDRMRESAAEREPLALYALADVVLQGVIVEHQPKTPDFSGGFARLRVEEILKGPPSVRDTVTVSWPSRRHDMTNDPYLMLDFPDFRVGERALLFLCCSREAVYSLAAGAASKLSVRPDGSFWSYHSPEDFIAAVRHRDLGEAPN